MKRKFTIRMAFLALVGFSGTWIQPLTISLPIWCEWRFPLTQRIKYIEDGERKNEITIDARYQAWNYFPKIFSHPKRWPRGSA